MSDRIHALERMLESRPDDARLLFGLAIEYLNAHRTADAVDALGRYVDRVDDEGNAWGRLGAGLRELGREEEAREAYRRGIEAARRHGHPSMAAEFEAVLDDGDWRAGAGDSARPPEPEAAAEGPASFRDEALPHLDAVYGFALRLTGSPDGADDLVQETFLRAYRAWDQYTPGTRCRSWLFTICRNVFLRQRERGRRHDEILEENVPAGAAGMGGTGVEAVNPLWQATAEVDPEARFFERIVDAEVSRAIDELPEEYRTAVLLSDLEGFTYDEIAELMDVPLGTVKSRLFRGRRRLQRRLWEYAVEMGYLSPMPGTGE